MFKQFEPNDPMAARIEGLLGGASAVVYDGDCPFCSRYVKLVRLRETVGQVELVDARQGHPLVGLVDEMGVDLNEGMAFVNAKEISAGADCVHRMALLSGPSSLFNRFNLLVFRSAVLSRLLYPVLRFGRNLTLALLGRQKISRRETG